MAVRSGGIACRAAAGDDISLRYVLPHADCKRLIMTVQCRYAVAVVDDNGIAVAANPAGIGNRSRVRRCNAESV